MESKLYEECHEGGGFMAQQAMLKQDETVRTQIRNKRSTPHIEKKNNSPSYLQFPVHHQQ